MESACAACYLDRMGRRHAVIARAVRPEGQEFWVLQRLLPLSPNAPCLALTREELERDFCPASPGEVAA